MIYFISDTHFYHTAIIPYCQRPFLSVDDMNEKLIENWNKVVTNEDTVYFLGDFGFSSAPKLKDITSRLNGYKIIIRGNHDRDRGEVSWKNIGFDEVLDGRIEFIYADKDNELRKIYLSAVEEVIKTTDFNKIYKKFSSINNEYLNAFIMDEMLSYTYMIPALHELCMIQAQFNLIPFLILERIKRELDSLDINDMIIDTGTRIGSHDGVPNYKKQIITTSNGGKE